MEDLFGQLHNLAIPTFPSKPLADQSVAEERLDRLNNLVAELESKVAELQAAHDHEQGARLRLEGENDILRAQLALHRRRPHRLLEFLRVDH